LALYCNIDIDIDIYYYQFMYYMYSTACDLTSYPYNVILLLGA